MNKLIISFAACTLVPAVQAADMQHMAPGTTMDHSAMDHASTAPRPAAQTASATGTVRKINTDKGTLTIAHGPVPALQWPAMVMPFAASAEQIAQVSEGDEIRFDFIAEGVRYRITTLEKR